jgi:ferric-dicitrate binding protein FerR (iron transport regulator)
MNPVKTPLQIFAQATEPTDEALGRVRRGVMGQVTTAASSHALLRYLRTSAQGVERVQQGALAQLEAQAARERAHYRRRLLVPATLALIAAGLLLALVHQLQEPVPQPVALVVLDSDIWTERQLTPGVHARYQGQGSMYADSQTVLTWRDGTLELMVEPDQGQRVSVRTAEAEVRVVGTMLAVRRDALGTHVEVSHGRVEVQCSGAALGVLEGGQSELCLPVTGAGMLGRAQALEQQGASSEAILAAVDAGLQMAEGPVRSELLAFRIQHLLEMGKQAAALQHIEAYLAEGTTLRRTQMLRAGARLAQAAGRCRIALQYLREIPDNEALPDDRRLREWCKKH